MGGGPIAEAVCRQVPIKCIEIGVYLRWTSPPAGLPISAGGIFGELDKRGRESAQSYRKRSLSILPVIPILILVVISVAILVVHVTSLSILIVILHVILLVILLVILVALLAPILVVILSLSPAAMSGVSVVEF